MKIRRKAKNPGAACTADDTGKVFFSMLDEAIDDMEHGRVFTEEQLWEEVDAV